MNPRIQSLINSLNDSFDGDPWLGTSVMSKLRAIDPGKVNETLPNSRSSIARLTQHIINWRIFAIEKLSGNQSFDIEIDSPRDWPANMMVDPADWTFLLTDLTKTQTELIELLEKEKNDQFLKTITSGREYDFEHLLEGIIQHDTYHLGQIGLINACLGR